MDVLWLTPQGTEMTEQDWSFHGAHFLAYVLGPSQPGGRALYVVLNAARGAISFKLPALPEYRRWTLLLDTTANTPRADAFPRGADVQAPARSVLVFSGAA